MRGWLELRITGRVMILLALWLLVIPLRWVAGAILAAAVHELGHLTALWLWDVRVLGMEIDIGGAVICTMPMEPKQTLCCALAGPGAGVMVCLAWPWFPELAVCGAVQTVFNLLPVYPLDGGRALAAVRNICCKERGKGL